MHDDYFRVDNPTVTGIQSTEHYPKVWVYLGQWAL